ncbi:hypothetical protein FTRO_0032060 [Fructobacillus tropaeoli]|uniref:Uncharacterized protein n=2 Tax=Fructobacillus tropaeoli TaxID=709323 RepID=A0A3F3H0W1_9LACO|nr:hypothetical protein FTRO_0032060 [Fructobacillus tropaeoli]
MNILIAILLVVMAGIIFFQKWQINRYYQSAIFYRYYSKIYENKAIHADAKSDIAEDLLAMIGYDIENISTGQVRLRELSDAEKARLVNANTSRQIILEKADKKLKKATETYERLSS